MLKYTCATSIGKRKSNQDNFFINGEAPFISTYNNFSAYGETYDKITIFAVCDGVGSLENSVMASQTAVEILCRAFDKLCVADNISESVISLLDYIDDEIRKQINVFGSCGTTITILILNSNEFVIINIGDSPAFLISDEDKIRELTFRQNMASYKRIAGYVPEKRDESILLYCLGMGESKPSRCANVVNGLLSDGEAILICSDGITNAFSECDLAYIVYKGATSEQIAFKAGEIDGADNCTAVIVRYYE